MAKEYVLKINGYNFYQLLGVDLDASPDQIRKAYNAISQRTHPDKFDDPEKKIKAERIFKEQLLPAYETLKDKVLRQEYDSLLASSSQQNSKPSAKKQSNYQPSKEYSYMKEMHLKVKYAAEGLLKLTQEEDEKLIYYLRNANVGYAEIMFWDLQSFKNIFWLMRYLDAYDQLHPVGAEDRFIDFYKAIANSSKFDGFGVGFAGELSESGADKDNLIEDYLDLVYRTQLRSSSNEYISKKVFNHKVENTWSGLWNDEETRAKFIDAVLKKQKYVALFDGTTNLDNIKLRHAMFKLKKAVVQTGLAYKDEVLLKPLSIISTRKVLAPVEILEAKITLANALTTLNKAQAPNFNVQQAVWLHQGVNDFTESFNKSKATITKMVDHLLKSGTVSTSDLSVLTSTIKNLNNFYQDPTNPENLSNLIADNKLLYRKIGPFWQHLKTAITTVIGIGCIVVGTLGLLPSLGASAALISVGALLCASTHVPGFINTPGHQKRKTAAETVKDIEDLLTKAKKIRGLEVDYKLDHKTAPEPTAPKAEASSARRLK